MKVVATNLKDGSVVKIESKIVNFTVGYLAEITTFSNSLASRNKYIFFDYILFCLHICFEKHIFSLQNSDLIIQRTSSKE